MGSDAPGAHAAWLWPYRRSAAWQHMHAASGSETLQHIACRPDRGLNRCGVRCPRGSRRLAMALPPLCGSTAHARSSDDATTDYRPGEQGVGGAPRGLEKQRNCAPGFWEVTGKSRRKSESKVATPQRSGSIGDKGGSIKALLSVTAVRLLPL